MPGITVLSTAGVPSGLTSCFDSPVRNPAMAGPNPTQTMSASMRWRSIVGEVVLTLVFPRVVLWFSTFTTSSGIEYHVVVCGGTLVSRSPKWFGFIQGVRWCISSAFL